jgi:prephenate dehydratase
LTTIETIAIQGERGSNSHIAAREMLGEDVQIVPCALSADVVAAVLASEVDAAVLPIENSLHGSVAEHYDLLLSNPLRIEGEHLLRIQHNLIATPGVAIEEIRTVLSHPVALSQCRRFLSSFTQARALPFYDTAGSVRHVLENRLRDTAGIAPRLAAEVYGGEVLLPNVEDHAENFTRFHLLRRADAPALPSQQAPDKLSVAFALEHRPGTLVAALQALADAGANLTKIESRPVHGRPWEYVFFLDFRFGQEADAEAGLTALGRQCRMLKELGRYKAA